MSRIINNRKGKVYHKRTETFLGTSIVNSNKAFPRLIDYILFELDKEKGFEESYYEHYKKVLNIAENHKKKNERLILDTLEDVKKSSNMYTTGIGTIASYVVPRGRLIPKSSDKTIQDAKNRRWRDFIQNQEVLAKRLKAKKLSNNQLN